MSTANLALLTDVVHVIDEARRAARTVNAAMANTYWLIWRPIVEEEQRGTARADYGNRLVKRLAHDLLRWLVGSSRREISGK